MPMMTILLVDDHEIVRSGLRALIEKNPEMQVLAEAGDGRTAVRLAKELRPDIVLMDVSMPDMNGVEATRQIREAVPTTKVLVMSMHSDRRFVEALLKAGANGYLTKNTSWIELTSALLAVKANHAYISTQVSDALVEGFVSHRSGDGEAAGSGVTDREREVVQLVAEGKTTKEIAALLHVSIKTVDTHRRLVLKKLGLRTTADLVKYAVREGITPLGE
jgi:two-component system, NarL family, response regulator NreC